MKQIGNYCEQFKAEESKLSPERIALLKCAAKAISVEVTDAHTPVKLMFICTHNSRRSQLAQAWAFVFSEYYFPNVFEVYSGGTEVTACHPNTLKSLQNIGFDVQARETSTVNAKHLLKFQNSSLSLYSKLYHTSEHPSTHFIAFMTCAQASKNCPVVFGAKHRFNFNFEDPKRFDDTPSAIIEYEKTALEIGRELHFLFNLVKHQTRTN
ncbi:hypothetical protein [Psychroflexus sp. ALD_RP9]|uniref:arsenate reductase/protein-tyrosine-phosphatase family protein n=1 Tax=Psychroflexus sp. ALD_RP9 TaxID=2777186 RepID=UPI001A8BF526|nr:hypothetical protein [Psychroflexus sp. ALD_RP9]QSS96048.1 hypothetical protein IMZ30_06145 [Psychroflexus sp. ALD_RP9]